MLSLYTSHIKINYWNKVLNWNFLLRWQREEKLFLPEAEEHL